MPLPITMFELIDQYAEDGDRVALLGIKAAQAQQLMAVERKRQEPDQHDRSEIIKEISRYFRANITYLDQVLEKMP